MEDINQLPDARSGINNENLQEFIDAAVTTGHALMTGQQQYQTPEWLAEACVRLLPQGTSASHVLDPQCAAGRLLKPFSYAVLLGSELDNRVKGVEDGVRRISGNCVKIFEIIDDLYPDLRFPAIVANPPFGIRWKLADGETIDSSEWTWKMIEQRLAPYGSGFFISNANTIEKLKIHETASVYLYQRFPAGGIWDNCDVELGIVHFHRIKPEHRQWQRLDIVWDNVPSADEMIQRTRPHLKHSYLRPGYDSYLTEKWTTLTQIVAEERHTKPWNIYLGKDGMLRTYLSTRSTIKLGKEEVEKLSRINNCHPLTLTTERETRKLMQHFLTAGLYTIEPEAKEAIAAALKEVAKLACPIMPPNDFELVAYADEEDSLLCKAPHQGDAQHATIKLTVGKRYEVTTGSYAFVEKYTRKKLYFEEETEKTEIEDHDCELHGHDRYVQITDDEGSIHRFMERPDQAVRWHHPESLLWTLFKEPFVPTVCEVQADLFEQNLAKMRMRELMAGYHYFPGQLSYYGRMGCKDHGLVAADVGTGKTLGALTLVALKSPRRTLIIAPQGTMRSTGEEGEVDYQASQWVQEIQRFAPDEPVFQLFSESDYRAILNANGGELPPGIFISYPQAYFSNGAFENCPSTWSDSQTEEKFCKQLGLPFDKHRTPDEWFSHNVGRSKNGIRCIAKAALATIIASAHGEWDMVIMDEAHLCCNLDARITRNFIRLQPKYRFALTATPIPNIITNLFSLMGWLCVPGWYKGKQRNAAWPYAVDEGGRFASTFLSIEQDVTAQQRAKAAKKRGWKNVGVKVSPIISSPARLLKLLKPNLAYISKEDCNPNLQPCEVVDVRVPVGKEQARLYGYWLERAHYRPEFKDPLTIAGVQMSRLRGVCTAPASLDYTRGMCKSNFNAKIVTTLEIIRDCLRKGQQVVHVASRVDQNAELARRLSQAGIAIARIDSTVKAELHTAEANRFKRGDARVMLMGIKCAQGHSFEACPNLIVGSLEWTPGTLHQAKGRVWRLNSPIPVKVWVILHKNTIEEVLFDRVATKQDAATLCLHGRRVPRDYKQLDVDEILAEHVVDYDAANGEILSETECETQWPALCKQLVIANRTPHTASDEAA